MNMEDALKSNRYCLMFKKVCLLNLFFFLVTCNAVQHSATCEEYRMVSLNTVLTDPFKLQVRPMMMTAL